MTRTTTLTAPAPPTTRPHARSRLRAVAVPAEHGGWGLTAEPVLLGLLVAPSVAGLALGLAAVVAFVAHTPLRVVLVDRYRARVLDRTRVAAIVLAVELAVIGALVALALRTAAAPFWWPAAIAAPLLAVSLWFDARSRSRRLAPELAGTIGISSVAAMIVLAAGHDDATAVAVWLVLTARAATSLPQVRARIQRLHGHAADARTLLAADLAALLIAAVAVATDVGALLGAAAVAVVVAVQRLTAHQDVPAKVIGLQQLGLGLAVVGASALGFHLW